MFMTSKLLSATFLLMTGLSSVAHATTATCEFESVSGYGHRNFACNFDLNGRHFHKGYMIHNQIEVSQPALTALFDLVPGDVVEFNFSEMHFAGSDISGDGYLSQLTSYTINGGEPIVNPSFYGQEADTVFTGPFEGQLLELYFYTTWH